MAKDMRPPGRRIAVNRFYWPDHSATSQVLTDLATHLAAEGRPVIVVTGRVSYHATTQSPTGPLAACERKDGVEIRRIRTTRFGNVTMLGRIIDYLTFYPAAALALMRLTRRGDVILAKTDPPLISVIAAAVARIRGARLLTWNQDLFPEFAAALGISLAGRRFGRLMRRVRNRALGSAQINIAINDLMADQIAGEGVPRDRIHVIPNWSDAAIRTVPRAENPLRRAWGLGEDFVIAYSGNLGRAHMADRVAELVRCTRDLPGLSWIFIGGGSGLQHIERLIADTGARNIHIHPYQPRAELSASLSLADMHLVSLEPACEGLLMPSKFYGIMAAGRPTLFLGDPHGAVARELEGHGIGVTLDPNRPEEWCTEVATIKAASERLVQMGARARALSETRYHPVHALESWSAVIEDAMRDATEPEGRSLTAPARNTAYGVIAQARARISGLIANGVRRLRDAAPGRLRYQAAFMSLVGLLSLMALYPGPGLADLQALKDAAEPFAHVAAFSVLALIGALAWGVSLPLVAGLSGFAVGLELTQFLSPGREPTLLQGIGAMTGVLLGLAIARLWRKRRSHWERSG